MIIIILSAALILRLISINQSLWLDEATTAMVSRMPLSKIYSDFLPGDFHPPLYYLIEKWWTSLFGYGEISLRFPSVIFALISIYAVFLITRQISNTKTGLIASALLASSGLNIYYSQEARMYSMVTAMVALTVFSYVKILKNDRVGDYVLFAIFLALVLMTDYLAILILPVFWVDSLIGKKKLNYWKRFIMSHIILISFFVLWLRKFMIQISGGLRVEDVSPLWWNVLGQTDFKNLALVPTKFLIGRISVQSDFFYALVVVFTGSGYLYLFWKALKDSDRFLRLVMIWLTVPFILSALIGTKIPVLSYFRLLYILPALYILAAIGLTKLKGKMYSAMFIILFSFNIITSIIYLFNPGFHRENWREFVAEIEGQKQSGDITMFSADSNMEAYIYYSPDAKISGPGAVENNYVTIWHVRYLSDVFDPDGKVVKKLEEKYNKTGEINVDGLSAWKYELINY